MDIEKIKNMLKEDTLTPTRIKVIGVGGGGGNAINRMIKSDIGGVMYIAMNTDLQSLNHSMANITLVLGKELTKGLGAGGKPEVGRQAAIESKKEIEKILQDTDMVFIATGMGGGTGTGAAPVIAEVAKKMGILTVGVVTTPFNFEGARKIEIAHNGVEEMKKYVDTIIQVPNEALLTLEDKTVRTDISMKDALLLADNVLLQGISGITELITEPGEINIDFADVTTVMKDSGEALMGIGEAEGENRALDAVKRAINNPILNNTKLDGARNVLVNIAASDNLTLDEYKDVAEYVRKICDKDALIKTGQSINSMLGESVRVTVIATGFASHMSALDNQMNAMKMNGSTFNKEYERDEDGVIIIRHWEDICPVFESIDKNDLQIPTILRQRAK